MDSLVKLVGMMSPLLRVVVAGLALYTLTILALAATPYVIGRYLGPEPEVVTVAPVIDAEARDRLVATGNLVSEIHSGSAPRDAEFVPYWSRLLHHSEEHIRELRDLRQAIQDHSLVMNEATLASRDQSRAMRELATVLYHHRDDAFPTYLDAAAGPGGDDDVPVFVGPPEPEPSFWVRMKGWLRGEGASG